MRTDVSPSAPSPTSLLYNDLVDDDVNGEDLDEDRYHHIRRW